MKNSTLIVALLLIVSGAFGQTYTFDWGSSFSPAWAAGATNRTANNVGSSGRNINVTTAITGSGSLNSGYPFVNSNYTSSGTFAYQVQGSTDAIVFGQNLGNRTSYNTITLTFSQPVQDITFGICDIDRPATGGSPYSYLDQMTITGSGPTGALTPTLTKFNAASNIMNVSANVATANSGAGGGAAASLAQGSPDQDATVFVTFNGNAVNSITIRYGNPNVAQVLTDPGDQFVGIGNFTFERAIAPTTANVTNASILSNTAAQTDIDNLSGADDETVVSYTITSLPALGSGVLYYHNGTSYVPVTINLVLTPAQAAGLRFDPASGFSGSGTFNYTALDNRGLVSNSSTFTINVSTTLPLTLVDFTATLQDNQVLLNWITEQELNTSRFEIEKSADRADWQVIATVSAAGNSYNRRNYTTTDNHPQAVNYYRLKMIDIDGKFTHSNILQVRRSATSKVSVYPNPFVSTIQIELQNDREEKLSIRLINAAGAVIHDSRKDVRRGLNVFSINDLNLPGGTYILQIRNSEGELIRTDKLSRQI